MLGGRPGFFTLMLERGIIMIFDKSYAANLFDPVGSWSAGLKVFGADTNNEFYWGENRPFRSASVIKMYIALAVLTRFEEEKIEIDEYTSGLLEKMITISDNDATNILIKKYGFEYINSIIASHGFSGTSLRRIMLDFDAVARGIDNFTSTRDCVRFLDIVVNGGFGKKKSEALLSLLSRQRHLDGLPAKIPSGLFFAGKGGELDPEPKKGGVENDSGLFTKDGRTIILSVFISDVYEPQKALDAIASFGKAALTEYKFI